MAESKQEVLKGHHEYRNGEYVKTAPPASRYPRYKYMAGPKDDKGKVTVESVLVHNATEEAAHPDASDYPDLRKPSAVKTEESKEGEQKEPPTGKAKS